MVDTRIPRQRWSARKLNMTLMARIEEVWAETKPWTKNFTLYTDRWTTGLGFNGEQCFAPIWECNDPTGKCKGNRQWAETFPAGYVVQSKGIVGVDEEKNPIYGEDFIYDENFGPMMNGRTIHECPYCN